MTDFGQAGQVASHRALYLLACLPRTPFLRRAAVDSGHSRRALSQLLEEGLLREPLRGVLVRADAEDDVGLRAAAAALVLPPGAAVCRATAAWLFGIDARRPGTHRDLPPLECAVPIGHSPVRRPEIRCYTTDLRDEDLTTVQGVRCVRPARTAIDLARWSMPGVGLRGARCHGAPQPGAADRARRAGRAVERRPIHRSGSPPHQLVRSARGVPRRVVHAAAAARGRIPAAAAPDQSAGRARSRGAAARSRLPERALRHRVRRRGVPRCPRRRGGRSAAPRRGGPPMGVDHPARSQEPRLRAIHGTGVRRRRGLGYEPEHRPPRVVTRTCTTCMITTQTCTDYMITGGWGCRGGGWGWGRGCRRRLPCAAPG
ncbi:MAG: hypothetical protein IPK24_13575 [Kineosporiaceae bacterium]|nr:hypothetical protein [Kineosporiaceae bacterium]